MIEITKPAFNEEFRTMQFRRPDGQGQLNSDETVASAAIICTDKAGTNVTGNMISDVAPYANTQVRYKLKGGTANALYHLRFQVVTSNNQKLEEHVVLKVI